MIGMVVTTIHESNITEKNMSHKFQQNFQKVDHNNEKTVNLMYSVIISSVKKQAFKSVLIVSLENGHELTAAS